jgi:hypothetical protein
MSCFSHDLGYICKDNIKESYNVLEFLIGCTMDECVFNFSYVIFKFSFIIQFQIFIHYSISKFQCDNHCVVFHSFFNFNFQYHFVNFIYFQPFQQLFHPFHNLNSLAFHQLHNFTLLNFIRCANFEKIHPSGNISIFGKNG